MAGECCHGALSAPQGHQCRMDQERDAKMWGREQGNGKTGTEEGMMRLKEGRRWEETELAQGRSGRGWGHAQGVGVLQGLDWCGGYKCINPCGKSSRHCGVPDVDGSAENSDGRIMNRRGQWENTHKFESHPSWRLSSDPCTTLGISPRGGT